MNGRMGVSVDESKAFYYQRMTIPQERSLIKFHWPSVTESSAFVQKKLIRSYLPGDVNLEPHDSGAITLPLCYSAITQLTT